MLSALAASGATRTRTEIVPANLAVEADTKPQSIFVGIAVEMEISPTPGRGESERHDWRVGMKELSEAINSLADHIFWGCLFIAFAILLTR